MNSLEERGGRKKAAGCSSLRAVCFAATVITCAILAGVFAGGLQEAKASPGYACNDQPCSDARKSYVDRSARIACVLSRKINRLIVRKARQKRQRDEIADLLNHCLARRARRCYWLRLRLFAMNRQIGNTQREIDAVVARAQGACRVSLPNGVPGNPASCEEQEASKYCPIANQQQAQQSLQQRCADLEAEKARQAVECNPDNCLDTGAIAAAGLEAGDLARLGAGARPTCVPTVSAPVS
jgi:hypothetical protein